MAYIRRLESGLWAATVRVPATPERPSGRVTESFRLESQARDWADDVRSEVRRGDWIEPLRARVPIGELWPRIRNARGHLELASRKRDDSIWRNHVAPHWAGVEVGQLLRPAVQTWVNALRSAHRDGCAARGCRGCRVGAHTIHAAVSLLSRIAAFAVDEERLRRNPVHDLKLPRIPPHTDRVLDGEEERLLLGRLDEEFPGRPDARLLVELMLDSGVRWEEAAALARDVFDLRRGRFVVAAVVESDGAVRPYAKTDAGNRPCAVSPGLWVRLRPVVMATAPGELVFRAPGAAHLDNCRDRRKCAGCKVPVLHYSNWHRRVWQRALTIAERLPPSKRPPGRPGPMPRAERRVPYLADPQPTPHDLRHTYGTRLADAGVPEHEIQALLGHADARSTKRYIHAGEGRFDRALEALARARAQGA